MFDADTWQELWQTISKHRLRTLLTCFGVFWGIFMLVILLGAGRGLQNGVLQNFDIARNAIFVWTRETAVPYAGFSSGREIDLGMDDMTAVERLPQVEVLAARLPVNSPGQPSGLTIERGRNSVSFTVMADEPEFTAIKAYRFEGGRFINPLDVAERRKVAVIGLRAREELFEPGEQAMGEYIRIGGVPFRVVGVFDSLATGQDAIRDLQTIHIPLTTAQQTFNLAGRVGYFGVTPRPGYPALEAEEAIKQLLRRRHKIAPDDQQALASLNVEEAYNNVQSMFSGISGFSWLVAIGTIIAGMVGVANIMLITVRERTREIGIRKALGAKPASIIGMIVLEAAVISGLAGYCGLVAGVALVEGVALILRRVNFTSEVFGIPEIDFNTALLAVGILLVAGILAGLIPGVKAARLDPVIALRDE